MADSPVDHVMHEVQDQQGRWVVFERFLDGVSFPLPSVTVGGYTFHITKFMLLELLAAGILLAIFIPLAKRIRTGELPRGYWWGFFEVLLLFVRDQIARPSLDDPHPHHHAHDDHGHAKEHAHGHGQAAEMVVETAHAKTEHHEHHPVEEEHAADKYLPFLWTLFMFILTLNLLGLVPLLGAATASIWVTGALALCAFVMIHGAAVYKHHGNVWNYLKSLWPVIDVPVVGPVFSLVIYVIELGGTVIKGGVLAIRLFANLFAGHMVTGMLLIFVYVVGMKDVHVALWGGVSAISVLAVAALSVLELFVAFLQAYVFTFLTALFMGMNLYPEH